MGLICNYGILFLSTIEFDLIDFFPLVGCEIIDQKEEKSVHFIMKYESDKTERILIFDSLQIKNLWKERIKE